MTEWKERDCPGLRAARRIMGSESLDAERTALLRATEKTYVACEYAKDSRGHEMKLQIKRVYEEPDKGDGTRILVDRLWPRGLTKERASIDLWLRDIAPSTELRKWFGHDPDKWEEFKQRYRHELQENDEQVRRVRQEIEKGTVTLVYGAKDVEHNDAVVLQEFLSS